MPEFSSYEVTDIEPGACIAVNFELADSDITYPPFTTDEKQFTQYINKFQKLSKYWDEKTDGYLNHCYKLLYEIICDIQTEKNMSYSPPKKRRLAEEGALYISRNLSNPELTIADISRVLNISPEYFRAIFRSVYGQSPRKYIINLRINKAKELMSSGEFCVYDIAMMCGFNDSGYFSTEFKKITSYTPTEYMMLN